LVLDVTGTVTTSLPLNVQDSFSLADVPPGTYTVALRAENAAGSSPPSNPVTLTFPGPCSGPPMVPNDVRVYRVGPRVEATWTPGVSGPAPTMYALILISDHQASSAITPARSLSGTLPSGVYTLSVVAANPCGISAGTPPQTIAVSAQGTSMAASGEPAVRSTSAAGAFLTAAWLDAR
jgi:hypothetical protein